METDMHVLVLLFFGFPLHNYSKLLGLDRV
jgi:hypothetical protein